MEKENNEIVTILGNPYIKRIILADVNSPSKLTMDYNKNKLFFCINSDEFSDQSFQSVVLALNTGATNIVPGIRNGFACAVDNINNIVYLGGSDGIYEYNYHSKDINKPAVVNKTDIFDMFFKKHLYFVETANQNLFVYHNNRKQIVAEARGYYIKYFIIDSNNDLYFVNSSGLYRLCKDEKSPTLCDNRDIEIRAAAADIYGVPHFVAPDGIYSVDNESKQLTKILSVENVYGLAFDKRNNIIYSTDRSVIRLIPKKIENNDALVHDAD